MHVSYPPAIAQLEPALRAMAAGGTVDETMRHHPAFEAAQTALDEEPDPERRQQYLDSIERLLPGSALGRVFVLSFLATVTSDARYLEELYRTLWQPEFTLLQRHFFYWQVLMRHPHVRGVPALEQPALYSSLLESYRASLNIRAPWIPPQERDADSVVVMTIQLLGPQHAPTSDCLDYCRLLQTRLNKKVFLINTAAMPWSLSLPYYRATRFNYLEEYSKVGRLNFKDERIDFYQCRGPMPNREETGSLVTTVLKSKPAFVLNLGHSNIAADLCSEFLTVAAMPFGTNLSQSKSNVYILPRKRRPADDADMQAWRITDEQIVETHYTYSLPERSASVTRAQLGLPDGAYVIVIVGNRLDGEITDTVAAELSELLTDIPQTYVGFLGTFPGFPPLAERYPMLRARSSYLGYHKDVLSVYEHCDAYFNPPRYGGGTSSAYALGMGLPVLTRPTGDVGNSVGPRFVFESLDAIKAFVQRAVADAGYRREWAAAARARWEEISDREGMLRAIVEGVAEKADIRVRR
jgi:glycosyltransferase involved in cell wall biosynthesis